MIQGGKSLWYLCPEHRTCYQEKRLLIQSSGIPLRGQAHFGGGRPILTICSDRTLLLPGFCRCSLLYFFLLFPTLRRHGLKVPVWGMPPCSGRYMDVPKSTAGASIIIGKLIIPFAQMFKRTSINTPFVPILQYK